MRTTLLGLGLVALGACSADIAPGSYLCGPEQICPADQACDGVSNTCVLPSQAKPFACPSATETTEVEPNNDTTSAQLVANLACASRTAEIVGCTRDLDGEDWFQFDVPAVCTTVHVQSRLTFPLAFEVLALELRGANDATVATGEPCANAESDDGDEQRCLDQPLAPGGHYAIRIARTGAGTCSGACAYNRYTLTLQLETP